MHAWTNKQCAEPSAVTDVQRTRAGRLRAWRHSGYLLHRGARRELLCRSFLEELDVLMQEPDALELRRGHRRGKIVFILFF